MIDTRFAMPAHVPAPRIRTAAVAPQVSVAPADVAVLSASVDSLHQRAEQLHGTSQTLEIASLFAMPVYGGALALAGQMLMPSMGGGPAFIATFATMGALIFASRKLDNRADALRQVANQQNATMGAAPLKWSWSDQKVLH